MYQILGPKVIAALAAWVALSLLTFTGWLGIPVSLKSIVVGVNVVLVAVLSKPVWRFVWNHSGPIGRWLSHNIYPDLNGTYDVLIESNWPVVEEMLRAARKAHVESFDPLNPEQTMPKPSEVALTATIEQTWFSIKLRMTPKKRTDIIESSQTIATIPLSNSVTGENELIYLYEQETKYPAATDVERHLGAARLKIDHADTRELSGIYWTNRTWPRGFNTAGKIKLTRK
jgi:predicted pore-forming effector associated with SMODS systems